MKRADAESSHEQTLTDTQGRSMPGASTSTPESRVFVALQCSRPEAGVSSHSLANIDRVEIGRGATRSSDRVIVSDVRTLFLRIPDAHMSARHACILRNGLGFTIEDLGSRNGTSVEAMPVTSPAPLEDGDLIEVGHTILRFRASVPGWVGEAADLYCDSDPGTAPLLTADASLAQRARALGLVAQTSTPILVQGESGTGKELLARAVHRLSGRGRAFVGVNCAALPPSLVEAQLLGHVRGAFSGAVGEGLGLVRAADGGTLFLDEIGDLPPLAQGAFLRVLQEQEVVPVGGVKPIPVDLRVVAATHRSLEHLVEKGEFRGDLFARIAGFTFSLPPLRDRSDDIGLVVASLVAGAGRPCRFTRAAGRALLRYHWPLNVRELEHVLRVASTLAVEHAVDLAHLPAQVAACGNLPTRDPRPPVARDVQYDQLVGALSRHRGNITEAARELGKARMQVQRWIRRFKIDPRSFRE